jgi:hypothetical protein
LAETLWPIRPVKKAGSLSSAPDIFEIVLITFHFKEIIKFFEFLLFCFDCLRTELYENICYIGLELCVIKIPLNQWYKKNLKFVKAMLLEGYLIINITVKLGNF